MSDASIPKSGQDKLHDVSSILDALRQDLDARSLSPEERASKLEQLKVYGRDPNNADPIFADDGIKTLSLHAFDEYSSENASREALSCLANAMFLKEATRRTVADLDLQGKIVEKLKSGESHDEFLLSRILLFLTYERSVDFEQIAEKHPLAATINERICQHAARYSNSTSSTTFSQMEDNALTETSKIIFNITHFSPKLASSFADSISPLFSILKKSRETPPLRQPIASIIAALLNLDVNDAVWTNAAFPDKEQQGLSTHLVATLSMAVKSYSEREIDQVAAPLVTLITKLHSSAPSPVKESIQRALLPSDTDRKLALGQGNSLSARLLRLSISPSAPVLKNAISALLFQLSGSDPAAFVHNVGFGYASGFLMSQGIPLPATAQGDVDASGAAINPVTGQRLDAEQHDDLPPMTEEEKEQEAERLFVLFERLKRTGVVSVRNPVEDAVSSGKIEELPD